MPVFDFTNTSNENDGEFVCTYTTFHSNERSATTETPILVLDNKERKWEHYSCGFFANQSRKTAFEFKEKDGSISANILQIDARLYPWLNGLERTILVCGFRERIEKMDMRFIKLEKWHPAEAGNFLQRMDFCNT